MDLTQLSSQLKLKTDFNADKAFGIRNINSITGIVDNSVTSLQALIFSNRNAEYDDFDPTKYDVTGITSGYDKKAFIFDLKKDYKLNLSSEITDHYVEDNLAVQDQIGLKPIIIEVSGNIAEVNLNSAGKAMNEAKIKNEISSNKEAKANIFNSVDSYLYRMGSLTSFAPNLTNQALDIYNSAKSVYNMTNKVINLDKRDSSQDLKKKYQNSEEYNVDVIKQTMQFEWVNWFKTQWWNRAAFSIVTPYGVFDSMYIMDLSATQPENSRYVTNLTIKFKQIRKAKVVSSGKQLAQQTETQKDKQQEVLNKDNFSLEGLEANGSPLETGIDYTIKKYSSTPIPEIEEVKYKTSETKTFNVADYSGNVSKQSLAITLEDFGIDSRKLKEMQGQS